MKKIIFVCSIVAGLLITSCVDNLDSDKYFKDRMTLEDVFTDETRTEQWLANAYSYLKGENMDVATKDNILWCFADDIYFGDRDDYKTFKNGTYDENWRHSWEASYKGIRQASIFIKNIDMNKKITDEERADFKAQARFVRAYYYWLLLRKYGPIPLLPDEGIDYTDSYDEIARQRNSYDECADYIASEMALAARNLPTERGANSNSRPTKGAALAARAKVLLYAASPINNPRPGDTETFTDLVDHNGRCLMAQQYDESKWAKAAAAALDVMKMGKYELHYSLAKAESSAGFPKTVTPYEDGDFSEKNWPDGYKNIDPFESYRSLFDGDASASDNKELIFTRGQNQSGDRDLADMVRHQLPSLQGGWNTHGMTQKQCDAYYMADGTDCPGKERELNIPGRSDMRDRVRGFVNKEEAGTEGGYEHLREGVSKQYAGREPRFYASVGFNGAVWPLLQNASLSPKQPIEVQTFYYRGNGNGYTNTNFWLRSGIGIMKFVNPDDTAIGKTNDRITKKTEPAIRYAEILLIYAEALNELDNTYEIAAWDGSTTYSISRNIEEIKKGIRPIRCRAGLPDYDLETVYQNKDEFRKALKRERQIELMGEGHRYFDLRRWKDAPVEESMKVYGCNVLMTDTEEQKELFHTPVVINDLPSSFSRKLYFWPIAHKELKRNKLLTQNPGWTYND